MTVVPLDAAVVMFYAWFESFRCYDLEDWAWTNFLPVVLKSDPQEFGKLSESTFF